MNHSSESLPAGQALEQIVALLDRIDSHRIDLPPEQRLEWLRTARIAQSRIQALTGLLTAEAEKSQAAERTTGTLITSWIATQEVCSHKEATRDVLAARSLGEHPMVGQAASQGTINTNQAAAIGKVLSSIGPQLDATQKAEAAHELVSLAGHLDASRLARAAGQVLRKVAPDDAEHLLKTRLQRQAEQAHRERFLRFFPSGGSLRFEGSLPLAEGERFQALITAHREKNRRSSIETAEPLADRPSYDQRQADALISLCDAAAKSRPEPGLGSARVLVKLDYQHLRDQAAGAGLIGADDALSAGDLRRLCCDAELIPVVLGGGSEVLDVGTTRRLVTPAIRNALILRDGGCAFPGCAVRPESCEAHHIQPWWDNGPTSLGNMVLLCHHHHGVVEPAKESHRDQWSVHIGEDGKPVFAPPARLQRFSERRGSPHESRSTDSDDRESAIEPSSEFASP
ncbi:MAG TPA: HNH endonuclease [Propionibacteriaceae bacterium]|nr:HNH endonuclease [Propionibacteriaceae bacterium]